jgi:hypothetical protein
MHGGHASCQDRTHVNSFPCHLIVRGIEPGLSLLERDQILVSQVCIIFQLNRSSKRWSSIFIHA